MANNLPIAILIDGDNASPEKLNEVIRFATTHGNPIIKRVYADWTKPSSNRWKEVAYETSFRLIEAPSYVSKKNTTDIALVIDAMDILLAGMVKGFCIVSSDSDYTLLAQRIREAGLLILGYGESKTPLSFVNTCSKFQYSDKEVLPAENTPAFFLQRDAPLFDKVFEEASTDGETASTSVMGSLLRKHIPKYNIRRYLTNKCKQTVAGSISIQCNKDFDQEQEINVYAYPVGSFFMSKIEQESQRTLAGRLIIRPNSAIHREEVNMVFVCVKTNIAGKTQKGSFADAEREQMCRTLYQALIKPNIHSKRNTTSGKVDIVLDVSKDPNFLQKGKYIDSKGKLNEDADNGSMFSYLRRKFMGDPNNVAYKQCFLIFAFGVTTYDGTAGQVEKIGVKNLVLFPERNYNPQVIGHESLHGYGLWHTHRELRGEQVITSNYKKYIYPHGHYDPQNATDNIMSYRFGSMITTWKWQWDIIKKFT